MVRDKIIRYKKNNEAIEFIPTIWDSLLVRIIRKQKTRYYFILTAVRDSSGINVFFLSK